MNIPEDLQYTSHDEWIRAEGDVVTVGISADSTWIDGCDRVTQVAVEELCEVNFKNDIELFDKWKEGRTGQDFIDANMIELNKTGFMSNRGRQVTDS